MSAAFRPATCTGSKIDFAHQCFVVTMLHTQGAQRVGAEGLGYEPSFRALAQSVRPVVIGHIPN
jgi:hypothetical protein